jgi:hypothetical protein
VAVFLHVAGFLAMNALAVWVEARPAPSLPDALISRIPYLPWVDRYNYVLWSVVVLPLAGALALRDVRRFCRWNVSAGLLALARGVCIALTGLGPVAGADPHAGMTVTERLHAYVALITLNHVGAPFALTKDLFFSGHTATTFLLLLYVWGEPKLRPWAVVGHLLVVTSVFFAHLHYSIDVLGAYAMTFSLFALREARWGAARTIESS